MNRLGTNYGGWYVPSDMKLNETSVIYSGGVGEDVSFDLLLQHKYNCKIYLIDPTSRAKKHYDEVKQYYENNSILTNKTFTGDVQTDYHSCIKTLSPNFDKFKFLNLGIWKGKEELKFFKQTNDQYVSQSLVENMFGKDYDIVNVDSIKNIMEKEGNEKIDLLKLDIEGAEIEAVNQMLNDKIYPKYLLIEFDLLLKNKDPYDKTKKLISRLILEENYTILKNDNLNITFVRNIYTS